MTVTSTTTKITYSGDGSNISWPFTFIGVSASDLEVIYTDTDGLQTTLSPSQYSVTINPASGTEPYGVGGTVTYPLGTGLPITVGTTLTIKRNAPLTQDTSLSNQQTLYQKTIEAMIDYATLIVQQLQEQLDRAIVAPEGTTYSDPTALLLSIQNSEANAAASATLAQTAAATVTATYFATYAAAQATNVPGSLQFLRTAGYYSAGDGGGR